MGKTPIESLPVEYRAVEGYPGYRVGSDGTIWSRLKRLGRRPSFLGTEWVQLHPTRSAGYRRLPLYHDGTHRSFTLHSLILNAFVGPCPEGMEGCHNNGNADDCSVSNLRWDTHKNNHADKILHGTIQEGMRNTKAKLTDADVIRIRERVAAGEEGKLIAEEYGVRQPTVSALWLRKTWRHLPGGKGEVRAATGVPLVALRTASVA